MSGEPSAMDVVVSRPLRVAAVVLLGVLNIADIVTTRLLVNSREANPIAAWLLGHGSYVSLGLVKFIAVAAVGVLALRAPRDRRWVTAAVCIVAAVYVVAVAGNGAQLALS